MFTEMLKYYIPLIKNLTAVKMFTKFLKFTNPYAKASITPEIK